MTYKEAFMNLEDDLEFKQTFKSLPLSYVYEVAEYLGACEQMTSKDLAKHFQRNLELSGLALIAIAQAQEKKLQGL